MNRTSPTTAIIPTYNRSNYLTETLRSILAQTLLPAEILVVDDGSTDDTAEKVAAFEGKVRYIRKENSGKSDTLNRFLPEASQTYVWIVDDDDIVLPHALETLTNLITSKPDLGFSYGRYDRFIVDETTGEQVRFDCGYWQDVPPERFLLATMEDFFAHHPGLLVRKSVYEAIGPFRAQFTRSEDYDMLVRIARRFEGAGTNDIVFLQRQHEGIRAGGVTADKRNERWIEEQMMQFRMVRTESALMDFLPRGSVTSGQMTPAQTRQALIARGAIMARKKLWDAAISDFTDATKVEGVAGPLNDDERHAVRFALFSKYGSEEILNDPEIARQLRELGRSSELGAAICRTLGRSLLWFVRQALQRRDIGAAAKYSSLALMLARS